MRYFPPEQRAMVNVKMTKCLYAMASHCRYAGDSRTGWNLPPPNDSRHGSHLLGIKISCGLELLVARIAQKDKRGKGSEETNSNENENESEWAAYLRQLSSSGYFRNLLEGSQEYNELLQAAKEYFLSNFTDDPLFDVKSEARRVLDAWRNAPRLDVESFGKIWND